MILCIFKLSFLLLFQGFQGFKNKTTNFQGFQGRVVRFQGFQEFQGFQGPADTLDKGLVIRVKTSTAPVCFLNCKYYINKL